MLAVGEPLSPVKTVASLLLALLSAGNFAAHGAVSPSGNSPTNPAAATSPIPLQPFPVEWPAEGRFPSDVSFLLQAPAGQDGFIRAKDGHLALPTGARFRIWGLNATMQAGLPSKEHAPVVAANLARRGINSSASTSWTAWHRWD